MYFYTEEFFTKEAGKISLNEQRTFSNRVERAGLEKRFDIFISYNIQDINVVKGIFYYLTQKGFVVYLDCIVDPDMDRSSTDKETAERIRKRLLNSKSLLYAQSPSAGQSNWMPWELGVVDGNTRKCMIMPVTKDTSKVTPRREYLLNYPYVRPDLSDAMKVYSSKSPIFGEFIKDFLG